MGLVKAALGAAGTTLGDQWRDYFYCASMPAEVLVRKGQKRVREGSSNTHGTPDIISNGSVLAINDGQCAVIVEQGKVVELCAEPGEFIYDASTEPSLLYANLSETIPGLFQTMGRRFAFGGDSARDQRIYFFNTKELTGNKYGTPGPIPFRVVDQNIGLDMDIAIRCFGEYSYRITNPLLFYTNVCGNVEDEYLRKSLDSQLKSELMTMLQPAFARVSALGIRYSALPGHTAELAEALNVELSKKWGAFRGIEVVSFGINNIAASQEDEAAIKELQRTAALRNPVMAAAHLVGAQAAAMQEAAQNESAGPAMAFMGMNMARTAGGANPEKFFAMGERPSNSRPEWRCACGASNTGNFCSECGSPRPVRPRGWVCGCGAVNQGRFCSECGKPKPSDALLYRCDKCGWKPDDPTHPPKFCPECGDVFDDGDALS